MILQTSTRLSSSFQTVCIMSAVMVSVAVLIRTFSSGIHTHPVTWNCAYHLRMELSDGGCFLNLVRNCRWTILPPRSFSVTLCIFKIQRGNGLANTLKLLKENQFTATYFCNHTQTRTVKKGLHVVLKIPYMWSERENQQDATVRCLFSTISQHVSGIIVPIFRRTRRMLLHVVCCAGSAGCGW